MIIRGYNDSKEGSEKGQWEEGEGGREEGSEGV